MLEIIKLNDNISASLTIRAPEGIMAGEQILIAVDEPLIANKMRKNLVHLGYTVQNIVSTGDEAIRSAQASPPDLAIISLDLKGKKNGLIASEQIRKVQSLPIVYLIHSTDTELFNHARKTEPYGFLTKTADTDQLHAVIETALFQYRKEQQFCEEQKRYRTMMENLEEIFFTCDSSGNLTYISPSVEKYVHFTAEEFIGKNFSSFVDPANLTDTSKNFNNLLNGKTDSFEFRFKDKIGDIHYILVTGRPVVEDGTTVGLTGIASDITERRTADEELQLRNRELQLLNYASQALSSSLDLDEVLYTVLEEVRRLLDVAASSIWLLDAAMNELICQHATGTQRNIVLGWRLALGRGIAGWVAQHGKSINVEDTRQDNRHFKNVDRITGLELRSNLSVPLKVKDRIIGVLQVMDSSANRFDETHINLLETLALSAAISIENARLYREAQQEIAERKRVEKSLRESEEKIKSSLEEKELLLKEIHHRVKNNMQIISSLLNLQSRHISDEAARSLFQDSQNRIHSIALVHEKLYQSGDLARINFNEYIQSLTRHLFRSYKVNPKLIAMTTNIRDIFLTVDIAMPCSLIISELVSNALKYAFPDERQGEVQIDFTMRDDGWYSMTIRDNGIGLPDSIDIEKTETLGMQLLNTLSRQLRGEFSFSRAEGTSFSITFPGEK